MKVGRRAFRSHTYLPTSKHFRFAGALTIYSDVVSIPTVQARALVEADMKQQLDDMRAKLAAAESKLDEKDRADNNAGAAAATIAAHEENQAAASAALETGRAAQQARMKARLAERSRAKAAADAADAAADAAAVVAANNAPETYTADAGVVY